MDGWQRHVTAVEHRFQLVDTPALLRHLHAHLHGHEPDHVVQRCRHRREGKRHRELGGDPVHERRNVRQGWPVQAHRRAADALWGCPLDQSRRGQCHQHDRRDRLRSDTHQLNPEFGGADLHREFRQSVAQPADQRRDQPDRGGSMQLPQGRHRRHAPVDRRERVSRPDAGVHRGGFRGSPRKHRRPESSRSGKPSGPTGQRQPVGAVDLHRYGRGQQPVLRDWGGARFDGDGRRHGDEQWQRTARVRCRWPLAERSGDESLRQRSLQHELSGRQPGSVAAAHAQRHQRG